MDSGYRIGRVADAKWTVTSEGRIVLDYRTDENNHYDGDNGYFEEWLHKELGEPFQYNGLPDLGWTWIVNSKLLNSIIIDFNTKNKDEDSSLCHPMFPDLVGRLKEGDYYVVWVDWS